MSKNNSFSVTTAGRYSLALYELAKENNSVDEVEEQSISLLKLIDESKDFSSLIKNPTNSVNELQDVINMIANNYKLNSLISKFLGFLISKRRFFYIKRILQDFVDTCSKKRGEMKAQLTSAKELSESEINSIKDELTKNFSSKIKLDYIHDIKKQFKIPILAKDFFIDPYQIALSKSYGCDCVLIIIAALNGNQADEIYSEALKHNLSVIVEVQDQKEAEMALKFDQALI